MSNLPISSKYRTQPQAPVPEAERNDLSARLNQAFEAGQIDQDQYSALLDQVFDARTLGDLAGVVEVLGKPSTHNEPAIVAQTPQGRPGELAEAGRPSNRTTMMVVGGVAGLAVIAAILLVMILF